MNVSSWELKLRCMHYILATLKGLSYSHAKLEQLHARIIAFDNPKVIILYFLLFIIYKIVQIYVLFHKNVIIHIFFHLSHKIRGMEAVTCNCRVSWKSFLYTLFTKYLITSFSSEYYNLLLIIMLVDKMHTINSI